MKRPIIATLAAGLVMPGFALAQQTTPQRLENIWNGQDHELSPDQIREEEKAAGLRGDAAQQRARNLEVDQLDQEILQRALQGNDGVMSGTAATLPQP